MRGSRRHPSGTRGAAREVLEQFFSVFGGFLEALGALRDIPERPAEPKVMPGATFLEISKTLKVDDSATFVMVS